MTISHVAREVVHGPPRGVTAGPLRRSPPTSSPSEFRLDCLDPHLSHGALQPCLGLRLSRTKPHRPMPGQRPTPTSGVTPA